ncbi:putative Ubx7 [Cryphonectria parasitica EP155]|uniref:UBX domain-containing protein 2 n=1 Tax=Cryphonectria parasitica (strain ATCC 38755 / EP155) TaxID=660469 RepID=A0A9P4Y148_CRYP1|nr:putative Ubx7 [Cryphonectria parasitica EP155]KAF3765082.1 putative Ubx7 [Cryphonectria parasitica EP155]
MVFFTGTLQEGISTALQQSKLVVCFVTDGQEESKTWENEFLTDSTIAPSLEKDAVVLRLEAGSQEAGYLAAIFPLPKIPTLVIIKNGELKEYVSAGTEKAEFLRRVGNALAARTESQAPMASSASPGTQTETPAPAAAVPSSDNSTATVVPAQTTQPGGQAVPAPASSSSEALAPQLSAAERTREGARRERSEIEKERRREDKGKKPAEESQDQNSDPKTKQNDAVKKASQKLAERKAKAREERARVLKLIADDKAERKAREEERRLEREAERRAAAGEEVSTPVPEATSASTPVPSSSVARRHDQCALQIRLFDGSTIRTRFPSGATLSRDVRKWIDESRTDGQDPYTFKVILTPLPNRAIDHATEEEQSLEKLGLTPSATLVLTPVDRYSEAYTSLNAGLTNPASRLITAVLAFVMNILSGIADQDEGQASTSGREGSGRIKGFQNPDDRRGDHQLYNGNSLNFEPRNDEDDKDK